MRYLVVGAGSIGKRHIENLLRLQAGEVLATDSSPQRRAEVAAKFGIPAIEDLDGARCILDPGRWLPVRAARGPATTGELIWTSYR